MLYSTLLNWVPFFKEMEFKPPDPNSKKLRVQRTWLIWKFIGTQIPPQLILLFSQLILVYNESSNCKAFESIGSSGICFSFFLILKIILDFTSLLSFHHQSLWLPLANQWCSASIGLYTLIIQIINGLGPNPPISDLSLTTFTWILIFLSEIYIIFSALLILALALQHLLPNQATINEA